MQTVAYKFKKNCSAGLKSKTKLKKMKILVHIKQAVFFLFSFFFLANSFCKRVPKSKFIKPNSLVLEASKILI